MALRSPLLLLATVTTALAEPPTSLDKLPPSEGLPDLLTFNDGSRVEDPEAWKRRREELKEPVLFYQYGRMPPRPDKVTAKVDREKEHRSGLGTETWLTLTIDSKKKLPMRIVVYKPKTAGPHPVIIEEEGNIGGSKNAGMFMKKTYLFIEYARNDLAPDRRNSTGPAQRAYPEYDWAMLAVWAWAGMRVVDYLETRDDVDMKRIGITGHSRGGKAALLAGAFDERITLVAPAQSGAGGAGCSRILGPGAESIGMNDKPDWYHERIQIFAENEAHLPFDQHFLKALVAPRGLFCNESTDDLFANPVGTHATSLAAMPVFEMHGKKGNNGLRYRRGGHSYSGDDWRALLDFAEWTFYGRGKPIWQEPAPVEPKRHAREFGFVRIGDPGNDGHTNYPRVGSHGAVDYGFEIGRNKVSNEEYAKFLNAVEKTEILGLYHPRMKIRRLGNEGSYTYEVEDKWSAKAAVTYLSLFDAMRYCNWRHGGDTESGVYQFRGLATVGARKPDAKFWLPTEDEWVKAAYYQPKTKNYRSIKPPPIQAISTEILRSGPPPGKSRYGMLGAADPIWEWTESKAGELFRGLRSDSWFQGNNHQAKGRFYSNPELELGHIGFRICRAVETTDDPQ